MQDLSEVEIESVAGGMLPDLSGAVEAAWTWLTTPAPPPPPPPPAPTFGGGAPIKG